MRHCIFHIPMAVDPSAVSGSSNRPHRMIAAFRAIGYEVDVVMGVANDRRKQIQQIKQRIREGRSYDFAYCESSTMPTALTEPHHLPSHPFLDFQFMRFCKRHGIPIGLFYRDAYWRYRPYRDSVGLVRSLVARFFYLTDLFQYRGILTILYVPTLRFAEDAIRHSKLLTLSRTLPPGAPTSSSIQQRAHDKFADAPPPQHLQLLYVGGVGHQYDIGALLSALDRLPMCELTVCCRKPEWDQFVAESPLLAQHPRLRVVHLSGEELEPLYDVAHICLLFLRPQAYLHNAMPIKLMEYLGHCVPVIEVDGSSGAEFVKEHQTGWAIPYSEDSFVNLLVRLHTDFGLIRTAYANCQQALSSNTWEARARQVANDLGVRQ